MYFLHWLTYNSQTQFTNVLCTHCLLLYAKTLSYDEDLPGKSNNQLSRREQWSTFATTVEAEFQESIDWIKGNCQGSVDHHNILAGWCLSLSQRFLIMFTKVCDGFTTQLSVKHFDYFTEMIGLHALDKSVFDRCVQHKSPEGDLYGDQILHLLVWKWH